MIKEKFVNAIAQSINLSKEDTVILNYGLKKIALLIEDAIFTIVLGGFLGISALSIVFQISFMLLRMYGGGYHSETELKCKIHSAIVTTVSLLSIRVLADKSWWSFPLFILAGIAVMMLSPVEAKNKPLSEKERKINHWKTIYIVIMLNLFAVISWIYHLRYFYAIAVAVYAACILMVMGIISGKKKLAKEKEKNKRRVEDGLQVIWKLH